MDSYCNLEDCTDSINSWYPGKIGWYHEIEPGVGACGRWKGDADLLEAVLKPEGTRSKLNPGGEAAIEHRERNDPGVGA